MKLRSYYLNAFVPAFSFVLFFSSSYAVFYMASSKGSIGSSAFLMTLFPALLFSFLMAILTLPIFLNRIQKIKDNLVFNSLTWFLLPIVYLLMVFVQDVKNRIRLEFGFGNDFIYLLLITMPFVAGLVWTFSRYRRAVTASALEGNGE